MDASSVRSGGSEGVVAARKVIATNYKQNYDHSAPTSSQQAPSSPSHKSLASQQKLTSFYNNDINNDNVSRLTTKTKEVKSLYGVSGEVKQSNKVKISRGRKPRIGQKKQQSHTTNASNNNATDKTSNVASQPSTNQQQQLISSSIEQVSANNMTYYTTKPSSTLFSKLTTALSITQQLREIRHTPCIMTPLSLLILLTILLSSLITLLFTFPQLILGIILGPTILNKSNWLVEFLYKLDICRWGHVQLMNIATKKGKKSSTTAVNRSGGSDTKKLTGHSSTINQRITVVPNRVYIHPIPNFMDNIVYLIVCLPPSSDTSTSNRRISVQNSNNKKSLPIIGILIDCGESSIILEHMEYIYTKYYAKEYPTKHKLGMRLHSILCTHRHHDHTAGIGSLLSELKNTIRAEEERNGKWKDTAYAWPLLEVTSGCASNKTLDVYQQVSNNITIVGGAVEHVPHCNLFVKNNCFVPLPCISIIQEDGNTTPQEMKNDMNDVVSIEVIGVPSHTRGSVVYALRNRIAPDIIIPLTAMVTVSDMKCNTFW